MVKAVPAITVHSISEGTGAGQSIALYKHFISFQLVTPGAKFIPQHRSKG